ncbi:MAG: ribonuclease P protein component [Planctomycetia bacterium]
MTASDPTSEPTFDGGADRLPKLTYGRHQRLRHRLEFSAVFDRKTSAGGGLVVVFGRPNDRPYNRLGMTVGRKYGGAVRRNGFKRLVREAFRRTNPYQPVGWDWVVVPTKRKPDAPIPLTFPNVADEMLDLMHRIDQRERRRRPRT